MFFRYVAVCHPHAFRENQLEGGGTRVMVTTCIVIVAAIIVNIPKVIYNIIAHIIVYIFKIINNSMPIIVDLLDIS